MRLQRARVRYYRSIKDSGWFEIEHDKTVLVGPNEAGKTALLKALEQVCPGPLVRPIDPLRDYPRSDYHQIRSGNLKPRDVVVAEVEGASGSTLRDLSDQLRQREGAAAVVVASAADGKVALVVNIDKSHDGIDAVSIVRELGPIIGGGGGGRANLAEAGGRNVDAVREALTAGRDRLTSLLA